MLPVHLPYGLIYASMLVIAWLMGSSRRRMAERLAWVYRGDLQYFRHMAVYAMLLSGSVIGMFMYCAYLWTEPDNAQSVYGSPNCKSCYGYLKSKAVPCNSLDYASCSEQARKADFAVANTQCWVSSILHGVMNVTGGVGQQYCDIIMQQIN